MWPFMTLCIHDSRASHNSKKIYLGRYDAKEDAVMARLTKEIELYREFAPQKALLETLSLCSNGTLA